MVRVFSYSSLVTQKAVLVALLCPSLLVAVSLIC